MKENKGITLVALIITIIVMLILVGVTISAVIQSDIIGQGEQAGNAYKEKQAEEQSLNFVTGEGKTIANYLNSSNEEENDDDDEEVPHSFTFNELIEDNIIYEIEDESNCKYYGTNLEKFIKYLGFKTKAEFDASIYCLGYDNYECCLVIDTDNEDFINPLENDKSKPYQINIILGEYDQRTYTGTKEGFDLVIYPSKYVSMPEDKYMNITTSVVNKTLSEFLNTYGDTEFYLIDVSEYLEE